MTDIRYYAIIVGGRLRLDATNDDDAIKEVKNSRYLLASTKQIIRETREEIFSQIPSKELK